jgi:intein-encoded DNA endonuclease-like protein
MPCHDIYLYSVPIHKRVNKDFFKKWSPEMAYVLGFFAADGYMTLNRRGAYFWSIQITDQALLKSIRKAIRSNHKISTRERAGKTKSIYRLQIGSREMCEDLRRLGMRERKTKSLSIPNVPKEYMASFVRGYFDGDGNVWMGYVHKERKTALMAIRTVFTSCSLGFLRNLKIKLEQSGILGGVLSTTRGNYFRLTYSIHSSLRLYDFMYNPPSSLLGSLLLERKRGVFEKYKELRL